MDQRPIGVFDSGLGGLTAVREMRRLMPSENIIYFGDTSRVPYGGRSPEILLKYARQDVHFLRSFDIKAVLVACGTVSTTALPQLQAENDLPILGVVEPACRKAAAMTRNRRVGLIATAASVRSGAYERTLHRLDETIHVVSRACPLLVPLVENFRTRPGDLVVEQVVRPTGLLDPEVEVRPAKTQVDDVLSEIYERTAKGERVLITTLTKKMAEDLTEFLAENKVKVRYLHSEIDTVERVEIIRDLRQGVFDVLVGINLLREGLDIPEVSLVAILDADKEGFLRSERSLVQTIGRAARNLEGKAILYADQMTDSMKAAITETNRRRAKQMAFNEEHHIVPKGIKKEVRDIIDGVYRAPEVKAEEDTTDLSDEKAVSQRVKQLEKQMAAYARDLEFEKAAAVRDQLDALKKRLFGASVPDLPEKA